MTTTAALELACDKLRAAQRILLTSHRRPDGDGTGSIAASSIVTDNGTFDISATTAGASITTLSGSGIVTLGSQTLTLTATRAGLPPAGPQTPAIVQQEVDRCKISFSAPPTGCRCPG